MSTERGLKAESRVAEYLKARKYKILAQNWRTRLCEIDLVAKDKKKVWFVEVKYRSTTSQGEGYEYVTPKKLEQMQFAAEMWVQHENWNGEYGLAVASVDDNSIKLILDVL